MPLRLGCVVLTVCLLGFSKGQQSPKKWMIDSDAGSDDGVAISLVLALESLQNHIQVVGITTVHGNTNVDNVSRNVLKILKTVNRLDIPVYKGANQSLLLTPPGDNFFGDDGFGDFPFPNPPPEDTLQKEHAVNFLTGIVRKHPGEINLLVIGPLTNIAMAIRMDPTFFKNLASVVSLGGSVQGVGNVKPGVEFNIFVDPEAAFVFFDEARRIQKKILLLPWEAALIVNISSEWRKNILGTVDSPVISLLNRAEASQTGSDWTSADTFAAALAVDPTFPYQQTNWFGTVETCGQFTRGTTVIDYNRSNNVSQQLNIVTPGSLNQTYIQDLLVQTFTNFQPNTTYID